MGYLRDYESFIQDILQGVYHPSATHSYQTNMKLVEPSWAVEKRPPCSGCVIGRHSTAFSIPEISYCDIQLLRWSHKLSRGELQGGMSGTCYSYVTQTKLHSTG